jgi:hypothetical protein
VIEEDYSPSPRRAKESCDITDSQTPLGANSSRQLQPTASIAGDESTSSKNMINLK